MVQVRGSRVKSPRLSNVSSAGAASASAVLAGRRGMSAVAPRCAAARAVVKIGPRSGGVVEGT
eukprot:6994730-Prymnesium_polylepis.1